MPTIDGRHWSVSQVVDDTLAGGLLMWFSTIVSAPRRTLNCACAGAAASAAIAKAAPKVGNFSTVSSSPRKGLVLRGTGGTGPPATERSHEPGSAPRKGQRPQADRSSIRRLVARARG